MKKNQINILIIDDDISFRHAMAEAIQKFGYKATAAAKAEEALNLVKIKVFHGALVDCMLPKINGVELTQKMRKTSFGNAPLILVSGVFKDKAFITESKEKTQALNFLTKPFNILDLKNILDQTFKDLVSHENKPLHVLVSKPFSSHRERTKVIEGLEEVKGFDLPFVICVLMEARSSGYLNIVNESDEIFGITIQDGKISSVDSNDTEEKLTEHLIERGYLTRADLNEIHKTKNRGSFFSYLIEKQYISPHLEPTIRREQVLNELKLLFKGGMIKINFVPGHNKTHHLSLTIDDLTPLLYEVVEKVVPSDHIHNFYKEWLDYPLQVGLEFKIDHPLFQLPLFKKLKNLPELLNKNLVLDEICDKGGYDSTLFFKALHLLSFHKLVIFDDVKKSKGDMKYAERMNLLLKELKTRNPLEVFFYFGASKDLKEQEIERIFRDFTKSHHPDLLENSTSDDLKKTINMVFSIVSHAHDVLIHPEKRQKLLNEVQHKDAEKQMRAENLTEEASRLLQKGKYAQALKLTKQAMQLHSSNYIKIIYCWSQLKSSSDHQQISEVNQILESIPHEERRTALYAFVLGVMKASLGDREGAINQFDKAISLDPHHLNSRREKSLLLGQNQKLDIFKSDISDLVGSLFKKKN